METNQIPTTPDTSFRVWSWLGKHAAKPLSVVFTATLVVGIAWSWQTSRRWETHRSIVSESLVQTQRLAWAATLSPSEDPIARATLLESKQRLGQLFSVLLNGGKLDQISVLPLPADLQTSFAESARWWFRVERAATTIASEKISIAPDPRLRNLRDSVERFAARYDSWVNPKRPADQNPLSAQTGAASTSLALNTAVLVEKLSNMLSTPSSLQVGAQRLSDPAQIPVTLERIQSQVDLLINGDTSLGVKPATDIDKEKLQSFKSDIAILVKLSNGVKEILPQISENMQAGRTIAMESELLRRQLSVLLKQLNDPTEPIRWILIVCNVFVLAGLIATRTQYVINTAHTEAEAVKTSALATLQATTDAQREFDLKREGANTALKNVLVSLKETAESTQKITEDAALGAQYQTNQLRNSGQVVMQLANAFHQLSSQATAATKATLHAEQNTQQGQLNAHEALMHWDELREQLRRAAAGLRKIGETNRSLNELLAYLPEEHRSAATELTQRGREALRDTVTGLVASTQRVTKGQNQSKEAAASLAQSHSSWINLLERLELCAGSASAQAEIALTLSKIMVNAEIPKADAARVVDVSDPNNQLGDQSHAA